MMGFANWVGKDMVVTYSDVLGYYSQDIKMSDTLVSIKGLSVL